MSAIQAQPGDRSTLMPGPAQAPHPLSCEAVERTAARKKAGVKFGEW
jgi:hypothetical protein